MVQLRFNIAGATQLSRNLRVFASELKNLRSFFDDALDIIAARSDSLFASDGRSVEKANPWPPLSERTLKARERRWGYYKKAPNNPGVLRWTGNLQELRNRRVTDRSGSLTFAAPYAIYHQRGSAQLPRRVVVDLSNSTNTEIVKALQLKIHTDLGIFGRQA